MRTSLAMAACLASLALVGCIGRSHRLGAGSDPGIVAGTFIHEGMEDPAMVLEFGGKRFEARGFAIHRDQNLAELRRQYGGSKHYDRIFSGIDTDHYVYTANPELRSGDGATMRCSLVWRPFAAPAGICITPEGKQIEVRFE